MNEETPKFHKGDSVILNRELIEKRIEQRKDALYWLHFFEPYFDKCYTIMDIMGKSYILDVEIDKHDSFEEAVLLPYEEPQNKQQK